MDRIESNPRRFAALALAAAVALSACQTGPRSFDREPAAGRPDPKFLALVEQDAMEALGFYVRVSLLAKGVERIRLNQQFVDPVYQKFDASSVGTGLTALSLGTAAAGLLVAESTTDSRAKRKTLIKAGTSGASVASLIIGTVVVASDSYGTASSTPESSDSDSSHKPENNLFGFVHRWIRPNDVHRRAQAGTDAQNAKLQADLVASVKTIAAEISRRAGLIFQMNAMEASKFKYLIENKIRTGFKADAVWRKGEAIHLDIDHVVKAAVLNGAEQLGTLGRIVDAAGNEKVVAPESNADLIEWLVATRDEARKTEAEVVKAYEGIRDERDPKWGNLIAKYEALGKDLDAYAKRLDTHAKFIRGGGGKE